MGAFQPKQLTVTPLTAHEEAPAYFSQLQVCDSFSYPCAWRESTRIEVTPPSLKISRVELLDTRIGISAEGQVLTGSKLTITGTVRTKLVLSQFGPCACEERVVSKTLPFSTFIVVPYITHFPKHITLGYEVEDYDGYILGDDTLYVVVSLLLAYEEGEA